MAKKSGLGKGLDALFLDNETAESSSLMTLRVSDIEPNKDQPRKAFEPNALAELADSIREHGVLQPLLVRPLPGGSYQLGGHDIEIRENGLAYLKGTETIAGSTLYMNRGLRILVEDALLPFDQALNSCTINPARCLGVDDRKGKLVAGYDADLVVLEDNYDVAQTYCRGTAML